MAKQLSAPIRQRFYDINGNVLSGGKLYSYQGGSARAANKNTYNATGAVNPNPVILDAAGEADVWIEGGPYLFVLCDANGVEIWARDNINNVTGTAIDGANGTNGGTASNLTVGLFTGCAGQDLTSGGTKPAPEVVVTSGYNTIGQGGAIYVKDATVNAAFVTAHPRWSFRDSQGNGYRLAKEQKVLIECFGGKGDATNAATGTDNYNAWLAAKDFIHFYRAFANGNSYYKFSVPLHFGVGGYEFSNYLDFTDCAYEVFGSGSTGSGGGGGTVLFFTNTCGIILQSWDTAGVNLINQPNNAGTPHGANNSHFRDLLLYSRNGTIAAEQHGVLIKCTGVHFERVTAEHFGGDGLHIYGNAPGSGNANSSRFDYCGGHYNGGNGVFVGGGDSNACFFTSVQANYNRKFGIAEGSFLGNVWIGHQLQSNGMPSSYGAGPLWSNAVDVPGARCRYSGHTWLVRPGQDVAASTTTPGTNGAVWVDQGTVDPGFAEAWVSGHKYSSGGAIYIGNGVYTSNNNNCSYMVGYTEGDQPAGWCDSSSAMTIGGFGGVGAQMHAWNSALTANGIGSREYTSDGTRNIVAIFGNGINNNGQFFELGYNDIPEWYQFLDYATKQIYWLHQNAGNSCPISLKPGSTEPGLSAPRGLAVQNVPMTSKASVPTTGYYTRGWIVWNDAPSASGKVGWVCVSTGWVATTAWTATHAYNVDDLVTNDTGKSYRCITAGTSAGAGGPTGTASDITDGTAHWAYSAGFTFKPFGAIDA